LLFKFCFKIIKSMFNNAKTSGLRRITISEVEVLKSFLQELKFSSLKTLYCKFLEVKLLCSLPIRD